MKLFTMQLEDDEHKQLKIQAAKAGVSMKDYIFRKDIKLINTPEDVQDIIPELIPPVAKNINRYSNGLCKIHGTPLDNRGKCLQKGCKYA